MKKINGHQDENNERLHQTKREQQQTDPQLTELKGFIDEDEDLEPKLEDGTKAPDKAGKE
jgi:hypothetical protein